MENTFEFIEFSHLRFELQCQGPTLSIQPGSSELPQHQIGRWNISMITIIHVLVCNNEIGRWVKTLSAINIAPLLKMIVLILAASSCFTHWAWTNLQAASIEDPGWILKTVCTYFQCAAHDGGSCCFGPCKNWEFIWHLFEVWRSAKLVDITDISRADRGYKAIHWVTCLLNIHYSSAQENNV